MKMTEKEWLTCAVPFPMLDYIRYRVSWRKRCHFACSCWAETRNQLTTKRSLTALAFLEKHIKAAPPYDSFDSVATEFYEIGSQEIDARWKGPWSKANGQFWAVNLVVAATGNYGDQNEAEEWTRVSERVREAGKKATQTWRDLGQHYCNLLRCIFGPLPFRKIKVKKSWLTPTVVPLAQAIYTENAFDRMPNLADALEEAGCADADILAHCRQPGEHVRGCWAVDLLLGNQ
jgi:hypothetical protein